jgi:hypothetical protein
MSFLSYLPKNGFISENKQNKLIFGVFVGEIQKTNSVIFRHIMLADSDVISDIPNDGCM